MIKYENECVGCPPERGCLGSSCPYMNVPRLYVMIAERKPKNCTNTMTNSYVLTA